MCVSVSIPASERTHIISDLLPASYSLWVTASTAIGEGPTGQRSKVKFFIRGKQLSLRHSLKIHFTLLQRKENTTLRPAQQIIMSSSPKKSFLSNKHTEGSTSDIDVRDCCWSVNFSSVSSQYAELSYLAASNVSPMLTGAVKNVVNLHILLFTRSK